MDKQKITLTAEDNLSSGSAILLAKLMLVLVVFALGNPALARAEDDENSFGFLFDHFQLTLDQGYRTEAAGPFYYSQQKEDETTWAIPPFFSCDRDPSVESHEDDFLYPLCSSIHYGKERRWQFFELLSFAGGQE